MILKTYPDKVKPSSKIFGYITGNEVEETGVYWNHETCSDPDLAKMCGANRGCFDVSKTNVSRIWERVSGRPFLIDPSNHVGIAVEKSELQYKHDGRLVRCPNVAQKGKVYQRFINPKPFIEHRVFYHWGVDFVINKLKKNMWGWAGEVSFHEPSEVFSKEEIRQIDDFCTIFGLDFGELDVLRDETGIYVIDVNNIAGNGSRVLENYPEAEKRYQQAVNKLCELTS